MLSGLRSTPGSLCVVLRWQDSCYGNPHAHAQVGLNNHFVCVACLSEIVFLDGYCKSGHLGNRRSTQSYENVNLTAFLCLIGMSHHGNDVDHLLPLTSNFIHFSQQPQLNIETPIHRMRLWKTIWYWLPLLQNHRYCLKYCVLLCHCTLLF